MKLAELPIDIREAIEGAKTEYLQALKGGRTLMPNILLEGKVHSYWQGLIQGTTLCLKQHKDQWFDPEDIGIKFDLTAAYAGASISKPILAEHKKGYYLVVHGICEDEDGSWSHYYIHGHTFKIARNLKRVNPFILQHINIK